jgi:xylan 1,4-beta-xylosidase
MEIAYMILVSQEPSAPLEMPWKKCIAVGRAYDLLRDDLLQHLRYLQAEIGYKYCRFHALFHDDMNVVSRDADGQLVYHWHHVDKVYDALLAMGLRPFVELNPMPSVLASGTQKMFHYRMNVTPPKDYSEWQALVFNFTRHCVQRYGLDEVRQWYFEVWNEPNLSGFWSGTRDEYWKLYDAAAAGVKSVDSKLRIGGPATSKGSWVAEMIEHCVQKEVPIDFVSTHLYPQDEYVQYEDRQNSPHAVGEFFANTVRGVQETVRNSALPDLEIHWTEWNTQSTDSTANITWGDNIYVDALFGASFIAKNCLQTDDMCDSLCYWTASDIFEEGPIPSSPFSSTYGLVTIHGIAKAHCNAFRALAKLRGPRLQTTLASSTPQGCGVCATQESGVTHLLLWNHKSIETPLQSDWQDTLRIEGISQKHVVVLSHVRAGAGSSYESWLAMGRPQNLSNAQEKLLRAHAEPHYSVHLLEPQNDTLEISFTLAPNEVVYIECSPADSASNTRRAQEEEFAKWDQLMGEKSR